MRTKKHDAALLLMPEGASHDEETCEICIAKRNTNPIDPGGSMSDITKEQMDAAIAKAVDEATSALKSRITELEAELQETEVGKAVAKAVAEAVTAKDTEISELAEKLSAAETAAEAAATERDAAKADLEAKAKADADRDAAEAKAAVRAERLAKAKEVAPLDEAYLDSKADSYADLSDEAWAEKLEEWEKLDVKKSGTPPTATALEGTRSSGSGGGKSALDNVSAIFEFDRDAAARTGRSA